MRWDVVVGQQVWLVISRISERFFLVVRPSSKLSKPQGNLHGPPSLGAGDPSDLGFSVEGPCSLWIVENPEASETGQSVTILLHVFARNRNQFTKLVRDLLLTC